MWNSIIAIVRVAGFLRPRFGRKQHHRRLSVARGA
jgi:hypothetical protein